MQIRSLRRLSQTLLTAYQKEEGHAKMSEDWQDYLDYDDALEVLGSDEQKAEQKRLDSLPQCRLCHSPMETSTERFFDTCNSCLDKFEEKFKNGSK